MPSWYGNGSPPPHQVGLATGVYSSAISIGYIIALAATYPMFGPNWRLAFYVTSGVGLACTVLWAFMGRERGEKAEPRPILPDLARVSRNFDIWLCGIIRIFAVGGVQIFIGSFPLALQVARSIDPAAAGVVTSMNTIGAFFGNLFVPIISDRFGRRKPFAIISPLLGGVSLYLAWHLPFGPLTFLFSAFTGMFIASVSVVTRVVVTEHPRIPREIVGLAMGFYGMVQSGGLYIVMVMAGFLTDWVPGYDITFTSAAILTVVAVIFSFMVSETGRRGRATTSK